MSRAEVVRKLLELYGYPFSSSLGINIRSKAPNEVFKWFLASILFGARISEQIVINTYRKFEEHHVLTAKGILERGWDGLVQILDEGGYVRYDFKTATKLLEVMKDLVNDYGSLDALHDKASDARDLERRIMALGKGIGPVTVSIFLRELRGILPKADPLPQEIEILAARDLGFTKVLGMDEGARFEALQDLKEVWKENEVRGRTFIEFESTLVRLGKKFCRRGKRDVCPFREYCWRP